MRNIEKYKKFCEAVKEGYFFYKEGRVYRGKQWDNKKKEYVDLESSVIASRPTKRGYRRIIFKGDTLYEHSCIFAMFYGIEELAKHQCVDHKDGIKDNNLISNLEGVTIKENTYRAEEKGLFKRTYGEINGQAKLTRNQVDTIKQLYKEKKHNQYELAEMFNISQPHVSDLINNKRWAH